MRRSFPKGFLGHLKAVLTAGALMATPSLSAAEQNMDSLDTFSVATGAALARARDGYFPDALSAEKNALRLAENRFGKTHPGIAPVLTDLATIHRLMGNYGEAESELLWALAIRERALGTKAPLVADSLGQLSSFYNDWGRWKDAEYYGKKAVDLREYLVAEPTDALSLSLTHLAEVQLNLGNPAEALLNLQKSRDLQDKTPSTDPLQRVELLDLMAQANLQSKKVSQAEGFLRESLEWVKKHFPEDNVEVGDALQALGAFYTAQKHPDQAKPFFDSAFKIYRRFVGVNYTYPSLPYLRRLAKAELALGQTKDAVDLMEKTLQSSREVFGSQHPQVALDLMDLALAEKKTGEDEKAQKHLKEALAIAAQFFGENHPWALKIRSLLNS